MGNILDKFKETQEEKKEIDLSRKLRIGIIGTGWIAEAHVDGYKRMPDVEIVAAADLIPGKAEAFMERMGLGDADIKYYPSHKAMIDDKSLNLDAVSICTYNCQHAPCTIYALENGINVLLEKPMCVTTEEAVEICRAEKKLSLIHI